MELFNFAGLILITLSNVYIGIKVRNQQVHNQIEVQSSKVECSSPPPIVTITNDVDYEKLAEALSKLPPVQITVNTPPPIIQSVVLPAVDPEPYWHPAITSESSITTVNVGGEDVQIRHFPKRINNDRGSVS